MKSIDEVFECWSSAVEMASDVGISHWATQKWNQRKRIPSDWWGPVTAAVRRKGKQLTVDELLAMHSTRLSAPSARACR